MPEGKEKVVESQTTPENVENVENVEEPTEEVVAPEEETPESPETSPEDVKPKGDVDERGVPWQNVAMENERKFRELKEGLPDLLTDAISKAIPQQGQARQYSKDELIDFKNTATDPGHRAWAEKELEKVRSKETADLFENQRKVDKKQSKLDQERQTALGTVMRKYPIMFANGQWNNSHSLTQKVSQIYNSREAFKNDGMGLLAAADIAFGQHVLEQQPNLAKATKKLKQKVRKLEKATLIEGEGQAVASAPAKSEGLAAREEVMKTGSQAALKKWTKAYLRSQGKI